MTATHQQKHQAGRHLAVAHALLRGHDASLIGPSTFIEVNGHRAKVQVAAQGAWQIRDIEKYLEGDIERVVLVNVSTSTPEFYILPGDQIRALVRRRNDEFMVRVHGTRPRNPASKHTRIDPPDVQPWRSRWSLFE